MRIVFHHPLPLDPSSKSASGIRPIRMLEAFQALDIEVTLVTGYSNERKRAIAYVEDVVRSGKKYDFVYSESSTMPTVLTDRHHLPLSPMADFLFFRFCRMNSIPIGLFYRDIYWLFEEYGRGLNPIKVLLAKAAYRFDLWVYNQTLDKLYLPSVEMGRYVPYVNPEIFEALPPGHTSPEVGGDSVGFRGQSRPLRLFYVGGMSSHYQLHELFKVASELPQIELTVCTREEEWSAEKDSYPALTPNIRVIHKAGTAMEEELRRSDIAVLFVKPQEYREFASPVKLYEYLGFCKPILASEGTLAGKFVAENDVGWTIPYDKEPLKQLLIALVKDPSQVSGRFRNLKDVAINHSWEARARKVIQDLVK